MASRSAMLTFYRETSTEPIICNIARQFNVVTNVRPANTSDNRGCVVAELTGDDGDIDAALTWATSKGVRAEMVTE